MTKALIFDSGVGGLTVAREIRALLPELSQFYVADDLFRPYGEKPESALRDRLPGLIAVLNDMIGPDIIVIACNTASTTALGEIRQAVDIPVVGVVPAIKPAAKASRTKTIGVLGTPGTVRRRYVDRLIAEFASDCRVILQGSTQLVSLAEDKLSQKRVDPKAVKAELAPLFNQPGGDEIDQVVLACTHFPLLNEDLSRAAPHDVTWIDSGAAIARRVRSILGEKPARSDDPDTALLVGPDAPPARRAAFARFGFERVIGLVP